MKNKIVKLLLLGFVLWLVPFIGSFGFFDRSGKLLINYDLFKSIMTVFSSLIGCYVLVRYFKNIHGSFVREAWLAGFLWLLMNLILDILILVPMVKMPLTEYLASIGLRYLQIPIICIAAGVLLQGKLVKN